MIEKRDEQGRYLPVWQEPKDTIFLIKNLLLSRPKNLNCTSFWNKKGKTERIASFIFDFHAIERPYATEAHSNMDVLGQPPWTLIVP